MKRDNKVSRARDETKIVLVSIVFIYVARKISALIPTTVILT